VEQPLGTRNFEPIFIGGTGRSGTTVLGDLLNEHSQVRTSNPTEIKFLANRGGLLDVIFGSPYSKIDSTKKVSPLNFRTYRKRKARQVEAAKLFKDLLWEKWWKIDAKPPHGPGLHAGINRNEFEQLLNEFDKASKKNAVSASRKFMDELVAAQFDSTGRKSGQEKYWAETTPLNIFYSRRLLTLYPNARFIVMRRDPRDVIASLLTKNWGPNSAMEGIDWIETRLRADHESLKHIPADKVLSINLEDLVQYKPKETYESILEFLGLEDEPTVNEFHKVRMSSDLASLGRWKTQINTPDFVKAYELLCERLRADAIAF
jgi:hypothetical protein